MSETKQISLTFREVAEALVKHQDIHEGLWGIYVEFGIGAGNVGPDLNDIRPAAFVPIVKLGLQTFESPSTRAVSAAEVNPTTSKSK